MRQTEMGATPTVGRISEAGVGFGGLDVRERKWSETA